MSRWNAASAVSAGLGLAALIACYLGWASEDAAFYPAWLAAWYFWLAMPLGAMGLMLIHAMTGGRWGLAIVEKLKAAVWTLPLLLVLFLPVALDPARLYPWVRPERMPDLGNRFYLNLPFFQGRLAVYFILWLLIAFYCLWRLPRAAPSQALCGIALVLLGLSVSFSAIDWIMSLEPHWSSSSFGLVLGAHQMSAALAALILAAALTGGIPAERFNDLANLLFAMLLLWAYVAFMEFLIIWEEDLPAEIPFYLRRIAGGWEAAAWIVALGHFVLPFLILLWWPLKRSRAVLGALSLFLLLTGVVYLWWLVLPDFPGIGFAWTAPLSVIAIGGFWCAAFLLGLRSGGRAHG